LAAATCSPADITTVGRGLSNSGADLTGNYATCVAPTKQF
jgi:hypothetical protein